MSMQPQISEGQAYVVDGNAGIDVVPFDVVGDLGLAAGQEVSEDDDGMTAEKWGALTKALRQFTENRDINTIELKSGFLHRMSMPGFTDATPWGIAATKADALDELIQENCPEGRYVVNTWFERDRSHVELRDELFSRTIIEWWDEAVQEAVEDGFLKASDWKGTAIAYAEHLGMMPKE